jgi:hypothetical protein
MLVAIFLLAAAEAAVVSQKCPSPIHVTVRATYRASETRTQSSARWLFNTFQSFVRTRCALLSGCTDVNADIVQGQIHLELRVECGCNRQNDGTCMRKATLLNKKLQDAVTQNLTLKATGYSLQLSEDSNCGAGK